MLNIFQTTLTEILPLRNLFLQQCNFQVRYNACHERGWSDSYLIGVDGVKIGYASVKGNEGRQDRDTVFEFYLIPSFSGMAFTVFYELLRVSKVAFIECQTNDLLLTSLLYQYGSNIRPQAILFGDRSQSFLRSDEVFCRKRTALDTVFEHHYEPVGDYVLERNGEIVGTGGFLLHYNIPFADLFMEIREDCRRMGLGSYLIQELKQYCYLAGRTPAARCDMENIASRATLMRAGMGIVGHMLLAETRSHVR